MDKTTFRIFSKLGLVLVIIGFFMPMACNLNGFELADYASSLNSSDLLTMSLYGIFAFSCIGVILLILLIAKIPFSSGWDWFATGGTFLSALFCFFEMGGGRTDNGGNVFQSGAYVILIGIILSMLFLAIADKTKQAKTQNNTATPPPTTPAYKSGSQTTTKKKLFCSKCGSKLMANYQFCNKCGAKI